MGQTEMLGIDSFAQKNGMDPQEVWRQIRIGKLASHHINDEICVFTTQEEAQTFLERQGASGGSDGLFEGDPTFTPPNETSSNAWTPPSLTPPKDDNIIGAERSDHYLSLRGGWSESPEVALLLDHLSLSKEENREIIQLANQSMTKISHLSETVVTLKDQVIAAKEAELEILKEKLVQQESMIRKLKQDNEDLQMLAENLL
jgi:hypothetical protein